MDDRIRTGQPTERETMQEWLERMVQAVSHQRHDWMNDLQLILGYIQLQKYDKLKAYVETIKEKAALESAVFKLGVPALSLELFAMMTEAKQFELGVEVAEWFAPAECGGVQSAFIRAVRKQFDAFRDAALPMDEGANRLRMALAQQSDALLCHCEYDGAYNAELLQERLKELAGVSRNEGYSAESKLGDRRANAAVRFPLT